MLFLIPGPVTTHPSVRAAAAQDYAPWDLSFRRMLTQIRGRVLAIAGGRPGEHEAGVGRAASWSLDLADIHQHSEQWGLGSHRFTQTAQAVAAFAVALDRFDAEGGQSARLARYTANMRVIYDGVLALGLQPCLQLGVQGPIVVNVAAPVDAAWDLQAFVDQLKEFGVLISNFYNTAEPSFRIGCIGAITPDDMRDAVQAFGKAMGALGIQPRRAA